MNIRNFIAGLFFANLIFAGFIIGCDGDEEDATPAVTETDAETTDAATDSTTDAATDPVDASADTSDAGPTDAAATDPEADAGVLAGE